jgi:quinol monooxygenase YgiN
MSYGYIGSMKAQPDVTIRVSEVWGSKEQHDASLQFPEVKNAIARAMPMLTGDFTREETTVQGGIGL